MISLPERYSQIQTTLGGGGMSDTLLCRDAHLDRDVVIKSLKAGVDPKRLIDELAALSAIRSKHVVQVYDVIRDAAGAVIAVVEEYLSGPGIDQSPVPTTATEAYLMLYPIAAGIHDIHAHGRVHRDIKPNNMRRDAEGCLKIYDFGLAKIHVPSGATQNLYFTPGFTAPEAFKQNAKGEYSYTPAVDVYAFGVTAFHLLAGGTLPPGLSAMPPNTAACNFSSLPQQLSDIVCDALKACLNGNPATRPTMSDVKHLLGQYLLLNKHRATLVLNGQVSQLSATNRAAKFKFRDDALVTVHYDGLTFKVTEVQGAVFINNRPVVVGFELPGACIIVMGAPELRGQRGMITIAISHPEVTL
jgi:eukaryotic-like serine/threonine-protein kinase